MENKVALITGASRGIGSAIALELAKENFNIVINYNTSKSEAERLKETIQEKYNVKVIICKADISNEEEILKMIEEIKAQFKKIDVLVNNAGICLDNEIQNKTKEEFLKVIEVNLIGTFLMSKHIGLIMKEQKYGKIINISSNNAINNNSPISMDYDASKAGIISLTHNFALLLKPYVNVNAIAPGWINTEPVLEMNPNTILEEKKKISLEHFGSKEEVAYLVAFLASSKADFINDEIIRIDGGYCG